MFSKEIYVFDQQKPVKATIRNYTEKDFSGLIQLQQKAFPPPFPAELWWTKKQLLNHVSLFPEGAICAEIEGKVCGSMTGLRVNWKHEDPDHSWAEITDNGYIRNHVPNGDTLYVVDICIDPQYRKLGLGKWLMQSMYETVIVLGVKRLLGGGRIPGFHLYADRMDADTYISKVMAGDLKDPVMSFLLRCGRTPVKSVADYLEDEESCGCAVLMEWRNPFYHRMAVEKAGTESAG